MSTHRFPAVPPCETKCFFNHLGWAREQEQVKIVRLAHQTISGFISSLNISGAGWSRFDLRFEFLSPSAKSLPSNNWNCFHLTYSLEFFLNPWMESLAKTSQIIDYGRKNIAWKAIGLHIIEGVPDPIRNFAINSASESTDFPSIRSFFTWTICFSKGSRFW